MTPEHWQQVKEVLAAALEREPAKRQTYLDQVCAEPSLRREVESLIAAHEQAGSSFMNQSTVRTGTLKSGTKLGPYEILAPLGAGGMGEVYQAHDTKLRRDVAVKVLPVAFVNDPDRLTRFQHEARMLASLNHPNIATIYGLEQSDGVNYLVMELVPGQTLAERVRAGPLGIAEALVICGQIAEALESAHEKGIVHRDLKPENVKVTPGGRVKVLDFGLAKVFSGETASSEPFESPTLSRAITMQGVILGTAPYMSPEQAQGKSVDKRTDIWAFGCILYELLTGQRTFRGENATEIIAKILEREPDWQALPSATPTRIRDLLRRCLQKDSQRRMRDLGDARIEVEEALAQPAAPAEQMGSLAVLPLENLSGDPAQEYFADGMTDELITDLASIDTLRVISRTSVMRYKKARKLLREVAEELRVSNVIQGSVLRVGRRVRINVQLIDAATDRHLWAKSYERDMREILSLQSEVARAIAEEIKVKLTPAIRTRLGNKPTVNPEAYETYLKGRYYAARVGEEGTQKAVEYLEHAIEEDPSYAEAYALLAASYAILGNLGVRPAKEVMPKAKSAALKALEINATLAEAHTSLGVVKAFYEYDWQDAERELKRAVELDSGEAEVHHWYAHFLTILGQLDKALAEFQRARDLDPLSPTLNNDIAQTLYLMRCYDEAIEQARKTITLDANYAWTYVSLAQAYEKQGRNTEAIAEARKAYDLSKSPRWMSSLGYRYAAGGKTDEARKVLGEMNDLSKRRYVSPYEFATVYLGLGEKEQAIEWLGKAHEARNFGLILLNVDPMFDPLRSDPRFQDLLRRMNLQA